MAGLSLSVLLALIVAVWVVRDHPYVAPAPGPGSLATADAAAASLTLQSLVELVRNGDEVAARDLAPAGDERSADLLAAVVANGEGVRVDDFTLRYVDELGAVTQDGSWSAAVDVTWRFDGFDTAPATAEVRFDFRSDGGVVHITGIGGGDRRTPLWMAERVEVRRTATTLVVSARSARETRAYAAQARRAVPTVRAVLPGWRPRLVVEVPSTPRGLDRALASEPEQYAAIAAVTSTVDGSLAPDAPVHVFLNPSVYGDLRPRGAQVVMSHEAVHIATQAATSNVPLWLLEGFADYVALRDIDLPLSVTARQITQQVRREGPPPALPGAAEFDTTTSHLGAAYEGAWLACDLLADRGGVDALVRFYRSVGRGDALGAALREEFGLTERQLLRAWQDLLVGLT